MLTAGKRYPLIPMIGPQSLSRAHPFARIAAKQSKRTVKSAPTVDKTFWEWRGITAGSAGMFWLLTGKHALTAERCVPPRRKKTGRILHHSGIRAQSAANRWLTIGKHALFVARGCFTRNFNGSAVGAGFGMSKMKNGFV